jgi:alkylation response protein AidB-like acyl-CoA dehydrogenase
MTARASSSARAKAASGPDGDLGAVLEARARALVPMLRERAEQTESIRKIPDETMAEAADAGLFAMLSPPPYGGLGLGVREFLAVVRTLAHGCASSAWTLGFLIEHSGQLARHTQAIQDAVFGDRAYALATITQAGAGQATPVEGGYRLTGRWRYATGIANSDWIGVTGNVEGSPGMFNFTLPVEAVVVHDTWHTSGMRGTGSHDVSAEDVFVPTEMVMDRALYLSADNPGRKVHDFEWIRYRSDEPLGLILPALAVGAAERSVEIYAQTIATKRAPFSSVPQITLASAQIRYARAMGLVRTAEALLNGITEMLLTASSSGDVLSQEQRAFLRLDTMHCAHNAQAAIQTVARGSGASMYLVSNDLQRYQRDIDVLLGHLTLDQDWIEEMTGRLLLGVDRELDPARGLV